MDEPDELDALLQRYEQQAAADVAALQQQQQQQPVHKRRKLSASDQRDTALSQPLGADNKGFKMLAAMGFQQGQRIGKEGTGLAEPLPLLLKQDKLGLGAVSKKAAARQAQREREAEAARHAEATAAAADARRAEERQGFQGRAAAAAAARRVDGQLRKAQQVCETLDTAAGVASSVMWHRPVSAAAAAPGGSLDDLLEPLEHQHAADAGAAVKASRQEAADFAQLYQQHAAVADAAAPTPRPTEAAEAGGSDAASERGLHGPTAEEFEAWQAMAPAEQLGAVLEHLRWRNCYCLYCGCRFDSERDMLQHCPGPSEADHE